MGWVVKDDLLPVSDLKGDGAGGRVVPAPAHALTPWFSPSGAGGWFASSTTRRRSRQGLGPGPSG